MLSEMFLLIINICEMIHIVLEDFILISAVISYICTAVIKIKKSMNLKKRTSLPVPYNYSLIIL